MECLVSGKDANVSMRANSVHHHSSSVVRLKARKENVKIFCFFKKHIALKAYSSSIVRLRFYVRNL